MHIMVLKYVPPSTRTEGNNFRFSTGDSTNRATNPNDTRIQGHIYLPMPTNLNDQKSVTWRDSSLNAIAADVIQQAGNILDDLSYENLKSNAGQALGNAGSTIGSMLDKYRGALADAGVGDALESFLIGKAVNVAGANVDLNDLISRRTGQVLNPNLELLFKTITLRNFTYTFNFTPRTREESNTVKGIIRTFKKRMSPKSTSGDGNQASNGLFISAPDVFQLAFKKGGADHPFLYTHKICALTNMSVNYTGTGTYATYEDATPVSTNMSLSFTELSPVYAEDYEGDSPGANEGVGF